MSYTPKMSSKCFVNIFVPFTVYLRSAAGNTRKLLLIGVAGTWHHWKQIGTNCGK